MMRLIVVSTWLVFVAILDTSAQTLAPGPAIDAIEEAKRHPAQNAIDREREQERERNVRERADEFAAARAQAWDTYERSNQQIQKAFEDAARDARLSKAIQVINMVAIALNYIAASDGLNASDPTNAPGSSSRTNVESNTPATPDVTAVPEAIGGALVATGRTGATQAIPRESAQHRDQRQPAPSNEKPASSSSSSRSNSTGAAQQGSVATSQHTTNQASVGTPFQRITTAEQAVVYARAHPPSDYRNASIPSTPTEAEKRINQGLAALNGLQPSASDRFEDAVNRRQQRALLSAGRDLSQGKVNKAGYKLLIEAAFPTVLTDGTKESQSSQNSLRRELVKFAAEYSDIRCKQTTGASCNFVEKLRESPCLGGGGCFPMTPASSSSSPSVPPPR